MTRLIDITGQVFGELRAVRLAPKRDRRTRWVCACTCGQTTEVERQNLVSGHTTSCGCKWHITRPPKIDLAGQRFGMLLVLNYDGRREGRGDAYWRCQCDCGNEKVVASYNLRSGASRSCGCQISIALLKVNTTHGLAGTAEYKVWAGMLTRCYNKKEKAYKFYGARGIQVDARWRGENGFANFIADMGNRPTKNHQIERENNDGPYADWNCRWATKKEQMRNTRKTTRVEVGGVTMSLTEACEIKRLNYGSVRSRMIRQGMTFEQAATLPPQRVRRGGLGKRKTRRG